MNINLNIVTNVCKSLKILSAPYLGGAGIIGWDGCLEQNDLNKISLPYNIFFIF